MVSSIAAKKSSRLSKGLKSVRSEYQVAGRILTITLFLYCTLTGHVPLVLHISQRFFNHIRSISTTPFSILYFMSKCFEWSFHGFSITRLIKLRNAAISKLGLPVNDFISSQFDSKLSGLTKSRERLACGYECEQCLCSSSICQATLQGYCLLCCFAQPLCQSHEG